MAETPDYEQLIRFLMQPFLDSPDDLKTDIEQINSSRPLLLRVAFSDEDRGRMFGRGGRNMQAIRTVLEATAALHDQRIALDVYGESSHQGRSGGETGTSEGGDRRRRSDRRPPRRQ